MDIAAKYQSDNARIPEFFDFHPFILFLLVLINKDFKKKSHQIDRLYTSLSMGSYYSETDIEVISRWNSY